MNIKIKYNKYMNIEKFIKDVIPIDRIVEFKINLLNHDVSLKYYNDKMELEERDIHIGDYIISVGKNIYPILYDKYKQYLDEINNFLKEGSKKKM